MQEGSLSSESNRIIQWQEIFASLTRQIRDELEQDLNQFDWKNRDVIAEMTRETIISLCFESSILSPTEATVPIVNVKRVQLEQNKWVVNIRVIFCTTQWKAFIVGPGELVRDMIHDVFQHFSKNLQILGDTEELVTTQTSIRKSFQFKSNDKFKRLVTYTPLINAQTALLVVLNKCVCFEAFKCEFFTEIRLK